MPRDANGPAGERSHSRVLDRGTAEHKGSITGNQSTAVTPSNEHICVWRKSARMLANEELVSWRANHEWLVILADAESEDYPLHVTENSRINALAVIAAVDAELTWRASKGIEKPVSSLGWPPEFIADVKQHHSIEHAVNPYVALRRAGKNLVGNCPFHADKTPSFVVYVDTQSFYCFGCQFGGDVIAWTQAIARITFREAVEALADIAGMKVPKSPKPATGKDNVTASFDYVAGKVVAR